MSRNSTIALIGILTVLTPFSGLPVAMRTLFTVAFGAAVASIGLSQRAAEMRAREAAAQAASAAPTVSAASAEELTAPTSISPM